MEGAKVRLARLILPSIGEVLFIAILAAVLIQGDRLLDDPDTGMHIRAGEYILDSHSIPRQDFFSHTKFGEPWVAHEWLAELFMGALHRAAGLNGLVVISALFISATFVVLYRYLLANKVTVLLAVAITLLAAGTASIHWLARPHILSFGLTLIWVWLLDSYQGTHKRTYLYFLPLLMIGWVNLHGAYITGLILTGIYLLGNLCDSLFVLSGTERGAARRKIYDLGTVTGVSLLATLVNPIGYKILMFPFTMMESPYILSIIGEGMSPNFHRFSFYEIFLLLAVVVLGFSVKRLTYIEIGLMVFWIHMSLYAARFIPIFALIAAPIVSKYLQALLVEGADWSRSYGGMAKILPRFLALSERIAVRSAQSNRHLLVAAATLAVLLITFWPGARVFDYQIDPERFPVKAAEFLRENRLPGNMYNTYGYGGYFIYAFYPDPDYRVFIDGRSMDLYGDDFVRNTYAKTAYLKRDWEEPLERYDVNWIACDADSRLSTVLLESQRWHLLYADKVAHIFIKKVQKNMEIIARYPGVFPLPIEKEDGA